MKLFPFLLLIFLFPLSSALPAAGVRKEVETRYQQEYVNRALTLKRPVRSAEQAVFVGPAGGRLDSSTLGSRLMFRVGEQVRITRVDFRDHEVRFDIESPDRATTARITFRFAAELTHSFPQQGDFDSALGGTFTEALSYRDVDTAKAEYIKSEFDEMVRRFVGTTSTSTEFVMQSLASLNPEYQKAVESATADRRRVERLQQDLEEAQRSGRLARQELEQARQSAATGEERLGDLRQENQQLRDRAAARQQDVDRLQQANDDYRRQIERLETQINAVADKLDLEQANRDQLGDQVEDLTHSIDTLQRERGTLTDQLSRVNVQLGQLQDEKAQLAADLEAAESRNQRLQRNYNRLTGDRNTVTARLAETTEERDRLRAIDELQALLQFDVRTEQRSDGSYEVARVRLGEHPIGRLEVRPPGRVGDSASVQLSLDSPDTVAFSERERELFDSLGESWRVEAGWVAEDEALTVQPREGEAQQQIAQREAGLWRWQLAGNLQGPSRVALTLTVIDPNDQRVRLLERQFDVRPAGLGVWLSESLSWVSLLAGGLLGGLAMALLGRSRRRASPPARRRAGGAAGDVRKGL